MHTSTYHMTENQLSEEALLVEEAKRDPSKFGKLYEQYYEQIFRYIYQRLNDQDIAADICSQTFLKAMTSLEKYEYKGVPFGSWLYRIAFNELNSYFRANKKERTINIETTQVEEILEEITEESEEDGMSFLIQVLRNIEEDELTMIEMRFFEKRSFREIGEILEITENNAKVRFYRIIERIKKKFKKH